MEDAAGRGRSGTKESMYLISWSEEESKLEASLGGRVTIEEMHVVFSEIEELMDEIEAQPFLLVLDYSKAKRFDAPTENSLNDLKDYCFARGAERVVNVVRDADESASLVTGRLQLALEGKEDFVTDPSVIRWTPTVVIADHKRLAA